MKRYFKTGGNIIYPNLQMLTWGPFYYHSQEKATRKMDEVLENIVDWCNGQRPGLDIKPQGLIRTHDNSQIVFKITAAWDTKKRLQKCNGIISVEDIFFEDENNDN